MFFYLISCLGIVSQGRKTAMKNKLSGWWLRGLAGARELGPYAAVELLLPGGSIVAVLLWLYRRYRRVAAEQASA